MRWAPETQGSLLPVLVNSDVSSQVNLLARRYDRSV